MRNKLKVGAALGCFVFLFVVLPSAILVGVLLYKGLTKGSEPEKAASSQSGSGESENKRKTQIDDKTREELRSIARDLERYVEQQKRQSRQPSRDNQRSERGRHKNSIIVWKHCYYCEGTGRIGRQVCSICGGRGATQGRFP